MWHQYSLQIKNLNEQYLACLMINERFDNLYRSIQDAETPKEIHKKGNRMVNSLAIDGKKEDSGEKEENICYLCEEKGELIKCKKCSIYAHPICAGRKVF